MSKLSLSCIQITTDDVQKSYSKYCGTEVPTILSFDATYVELTFVSDSSVTKSGFEIAYKVLSRKGYHTLFVM